MKKALIPVLVSLSFSLSAAPRRRSLPQPEWFPRCSVITGLPAVTFTRDQGRTLTPIAEGLSGVGYTYGLVALDEPKTLLAWHKSTLSLSSDGGCSWRPVGQIADFDFPPRLVAGRGGRAYAWSDARVYLIRYDSRGPVALKSPGALIGLAVDPLNAEHIRAGDTDGAIWDSVDGGASFTRIGSLKSALLYRFAFDPHNLDHIVAGTATTGAYVTFDGGLTWTRSGTASANVFELAISPADSNTVFAEGINLAESDANVPSHGRHIYLSRDGGATYKPVVDEAPGVQLVNGPTMAAHPTNRDVVYFIFGTYFQGYGTDVFRYDDAAHALTVEHNGYDDVNAIAFDRDDPNLMYLGLEVVKP